MQGIGERSFESVSKDKPARRRRAAFDTDEKDVTKKDVKTPFFVPSFEDRHGVTIIMKSIPFYSFLIPDIPYADQELERRLRDGPGRQLFLSK